MALHRPSSSLDEDDTRPVQRYHCSSVTIGAVPWIRPRFPLKDRPTLGDDDALGPRSKIGAPTTTADPGGSNCISGTYVIKAGDLPSRVANKFDVTVDQLAAANINTPGYRNFVVGTEINIPKKEG